MFDKKKNDERMKRRKHKYEIYQRSFLREGTMVAFPLCFPGAAAPIPADESRITALDITKEGFVYGGTSGRRAHLFVGILHAATGMVFDLGVAEGAEDSAAVCCGQSKFIACVNGAAGGRVIMGKLQAMPYDLLQEWGFTRAPLEDSSEVVKNERILHAVADASRKYAVGVTENHLFSVEIESGKIEIIGQVNGRGRLCADLKGNVFGLDEGNTLWKYNAATQGLARKAVTLPGGVWRKSPILWAKNPVNGKLFAADDNGNFFSPTEGEGFKGPLAKLPVTPAGPMAATFDGRIFGFCGDGIAKMFCYDPAAGEVKDLGGAVSVIERRRYGFRFADAVAGRDGQIIFAEDDDLGHLWLYFPKIQPIKTS